MKSLFDLVVTSDRANPRFLEMRTARSFTAARRLMDDVFADFQDVDHSFIREFQTGGFSARVFELALFCALREQGLTLDRSSASPDFVVSGTHPFAIEATTSNPSGDEPADGVGISRGPHLLVPDDPPTAEQEFIFQAGKVIRRKLTKRDAAGKAYWEQPNVSGLPFAIALESFHGVDSLFHSIGPLGEYLYGQRDVASFDTDGRLLLIAEQVTEHRFGNKTIPSGLFSIPDSDAEHLAAVLFSNSATISKFHRIGTELGYGPGDIAMTRLGMVVDPDPNAAVPQRFGYLVGDYGPEDREPFSEGWHVFHNPYAKIPLHREALPAFTHHELLEDGRVLTTAPRLDPLVSQTWAFEGSGALRFAIDRLEHFLRGDVDAVEGQAP